MGPNKLDGNLSLFTIDRLDDETCTALKNMPDEKMCDAIRSPNPIPETDDQVYELEIRPQPNGKLCAFCDKEFPSLNEFRTHMKHNGYICNNCLDYFSDMPWFALA